MADKQKPKAKPKTADLGGLLGSSAPVGDGTYNPNTPIGVGQNYKAPNGTAPQYYPGAETNLLAGMSGNDVADLQLSLKQLGLIPASTHITLGVWDGTSASAFRDVLSWANARGSTWQQARDEMVQTALVTPQLDPAAPQRDATNPLDLQALARQAGTKGLGRGLTDAELGRVTGSLQAAQAPFLPGTSTVAPPGQAGMQEVAKNAVKAIDPVRFDSRNVVKVASVISQMLAGHQSQAQLPGEGG